jgi:hypothetical protein
LVSLCNSFIIFLFLYIFICSTLIMYGLTFIQNVNFHIRFFVIFNFGFKCGCPSLGCLKSVHSTRDGTKFVCKVHGGNVVYTIKYNFVWHLWTRHNVIMEMGKLECPSTQEEGPRHRGHECVSLEQPPSLGVSCWKYYSRFTISIKYWVK